MKIVVPTTSLDKPAVRALDREGIAAEIVLLEDDFAYSRLLCDLWRKQEGFIILEHDVVPWIGALDVLVDCSEDWCSYEYPPAPNKLMHSMGCIKLSDNIIKDNKNLYEKWKGSFWSQIDGKLIPALLNAGYIEHIHYPPLAHVK